MLNLLEVVALTALGGAMLALLELVKRGMG